MLSLPPADFQDEGMHLQTVYPDASSWRKKDGNEALAVAECSLDKRGDLITPANRAKLLQEWSPFWNTDLPVLAEKSMYHRCTPIQHTITCDVCFSPPLLNCRSPQRRANAVSTKPFPSAEP
jgi:hypothetical protein